LDAAFASDGCDCAVSPLETLLSVDTAMNSI
jgi:hypothetical protein